MGSGASQEGAMEEELEDMDDPPEEEAKRKASEKDFRKVRRPGGNPWANRWFL